MHFYLYKEKCTILLKMTFTLRPTTVISYLHLPSVCLRILKKDPALLSLFNPPPPPPPGGAAKTNPIDNYKSERAVFFGFYGGGTRCGGG
jgi:hypothetical protein